MPHQQVDGDAERRVGGDAGVAVGAAALQRQREVRRRHRLARHLVRVRQHLADQLDAPLDRLRGAAGVLDAERAQQRRLLSSRRRAAS